MERNYRATLKLKGKYVNVIFRADRTGYCCRSA